MAKTTLDQALDDPELAEILDSPSPHADKIRHMNDHLRTTVKSNYGKWVFTQSITAATWNTILAIVKAVKEFDAFTGDNDPYGEHDCAIFEVDGVKYMFKIDYYADSSCRWGSEFPHDPSQSYRVLTVLEASEY